MMEGGNKIASVPVALPVTKFLREIFCYFNRKLVFSLQKLIENKPAGQNSSLYKPIIWQINLCFWENFSIQQDGKLRPMKIYEITLEQMTILTRKLLID